MNVVEDGVRDLINRELESATERYGLFSSVHEAYAVTLEESEEAREAMYLINTSLQHFWDGIRSNSCWETLESAVREVEQHAIALACEAIQVAAMASKFYASFAEEGEHINVDE